MNTPEIRINETYGFEVSADGKVYRKGKELHQNIGHFGYRRVCIGAGKTVHVHRLVAEAFCEGRQPDLVVNHIDGDVTNNKASNLEWITRSQNTRQGNARKMASIPDSVRNSMKEDTHTFMLAINKRDWMNFIVVAKSNGFTTTSAWARKVLGDAVSEYFSRL